MVPQIGGSRRALNGLDFARRKLRRRPTNKGGYRPGSRFASGKSIGRHPAGALASRQAVPRSAARWSVISFQLEGRVRDVALHWA
jgi:hypothetical protein